MSTTTPEDQEKLIQNNHSLPETEKSPGTGDDIIVYHRRWYVLFVYIYLTFVSNLIWNTWGPITDSVKGVFCWTDGDIALLVLWGPITYLVSAGFSAWLMDVKGLRWSLLFVSILMCLGAGMRCITSTIPAATWLIHTGQILNGLAGPVCMAAPPFLSVVWFPVHQRATATALAASLGSVGAAFSFIFGPLLVSDYTLSNNTCVLANSSHHGNMSNSTNAEIEKIRSEIMIYMYIVFAAACVGLLMVVVYLPARPPTPPSRTAGVKRLEFKVALRQLCRPGLFWLLCLPYGIACGVYNMWTSIIDLVLLDLPFKITQDTIGWIGFSGLIGGLVAQAAIGWFADIFSRHMKMFLIGLFSIALLCFIWFTLLCLNIIPSSLWGLFVSFTLAGICLNGGVPLFFELFCEAVYPVSEGIANSLLTLMNNIFGLIFTLIKTIPNIGKSNNWMNYTMIGVVAGCLPLLGLFKSKYPRLEIDTVIVNEETNDQKDQQYSE